MSAVTNTSLLLVVCVSESRRTYVTVSSVYSSESHKQPHSEGRELLVLRFLQVILKRWINRPCTGTRFSRSACWWVQSRIFLFFFIVVIKLLGSLAGSVCDADSVNSDASVYLSHWCHCGWESGSQVQTGVVTSLPVLYYRCMHGRSLTSCCSSNRMWSLVTLLLRPWKWRSRPRSTSFHLRPTMLWETLCWPTSRTSKTCPPSLSLR